MESLMLMEARQAMEVAQARVHNRRLKWQSLVVSAALALVALLGSITGDVLGLFTTGQAWAFGLFGTVVFAGIAITIGVAIDDEKGTLIELKHKHEAASRRYFNELEKSLG